MPFIVGCEIARATSVTCETVFRWLVPRRTMRLGIVRPDKMPRLLSLEWRPDIDVGDDLVLFPVARASEDFGVGYILNRRSGVLSENPRLYAIAGGIRPFAVAPLVLLALTHLVAVMLEGHLSPLEKTVEVTAAFAFGAVGYRIGKALKWFAAGRRVEALERYALNIQSGLKSGRISVS
ncbi:MAG: hypothetical protein E6Q76_14360 [Rhizobium sp.]|nr:MAG: hypothetical protein E6Q76_14360 [Rhizobium sp.]